jgi:hypothetical protein
MKTGNYNKNYSDSKYKLRIIIYVDNKDGPCGIGGKYCSDCDFHGNKLSTQ